MSRIVSVFLPHLPIERLKRKRLGTGHTPINDKSIFDRRPFALVGTETRGLILTAVNAKAEGNGLYSGMGLADARAICPHLLTLPSAPDRDAETLRALARICVRYSPTLNIEGEDELWLDITGVPHLFGGETELLASITQVFHSFGFSAQLALAPTLGAAHALARFGRASPIIVADGGIDSDLAPLPVEALRLDPDVTRLLRRLGLKRIGQLYDLPRASLERRFHSKEATEAVLLRLDQARGIKQEKQAPLFPAPRYEATLAFAKPLVSHDGIIAVLELITTELCQKLACGRIGARRLRLRIDRADGSRTEIETGLSAPSREFLHLSRLLQEKLAALDMGFGVDRMSLVAFVAEPLPLTQVSLTDTGEKLSPEPLIDRLANRLGTFAVRRLHRQASHLPERAQSIRTAFAPSSPWAQIEPAKPPRPPLLLAEPEPLKVLAEIPEGPPARFTWRRLSRRVVKSEGPERITHEWWRELKPGKTDARPRDYYRIEDEEGHRYWVFREGLYQKSGDAPVWYLHGVFG
ncbi:MAG TPA: DNA polymerase Y family protein [Methyloceanibacter sp.]